MFRFDLKGLCQVKERKIVFSFKVFFSNLALDKTNITNNNSFISKKMYSRLIRNALPILTGVFVLDFGRFPLSGVMGGSGVFALLASTKEFHAKFS